MTKYKRLDNETDEELIYRICLNKDTIGTWNDVKDILNELLNVDYGESTYRKKFQVFEKMFSANQNRFLNSDERLIELNNKLNDIRKERVKLQTANIERSRIDRSESRQEMYYEYVGKMVETLPLPQFNTLYPDIRHKKEYLVTLADIHYGAKFKSENNEYSPDIAKGRLQYLTSKIISFVKSHKLNTIKIVSLGDILQGILRLNDLKINDSSVVKATVEISRLIALFLNEISAYSQVEYYHTPTANHTQIRPLGSKANEIADEDLEYVIGHYIKDLCSHNERINVHLASDGKQYIDIPIFDYDVVAMHGHTIKNIETSIRDLSMIRQSFINYLILGHYHNGKEIPSFESNYSDTEILISPSFVGSDPYSDSLMRGSKASVKIYGFDSLYGHTETYKIILN